MRVSTGMIYDSGLASMQNRTSTLLRTQQQLSTGRRILAPSDDPVAAARALEVQQSLAANKAQAETRNNVKSAAGIADAQLQSVTDLLGRVRELTVQAGDAALSTQDRRSIALELRQRFEELVALANAKDGLGNSLFGGFQIGNKPFAGSVEDGVRYLGDDGQRALQVSNSRQLGISQSGNDIFMRIKNGNGVFATSTQNEKSVNATHITYEGTATLAAPLTTGSFDIQFTSETAYAFVDGNGTTFHTGTYTSGSPINLADAGPTFDYGASLVFTGSPSAGDSFTVERTATDIAVTEKNITANAARATIDAGSVSDPIKWSQSGNNGDLEIRFWVDVQNARGGGAGATYYDVVDATTGNSLNSSPLGPSSTASTYKPFIPSAAGTTISLANAGPTPAGVYDFGASVKIAGIPASGDAFTIKTSEDYSGNGYFVTAAKTEMAYNTGSGIIGTGDVLDEAKWNHPANSRNLEIRFWQDPQDLANPKTTYYDLVDAETERSLFTDGASTAGGSGNTFTRVFESGDAIDFSGLAVPYGADTITDFGISVTINGDPASGDAFKVRASESQSVFDTLATTIRLLESGKPIETMGNVQLSNELGAMLTNLSRAEDSILSARAVFGSGLAEVDSLDSVGEDLNIQYEETLSRLQDLDYADAITRLTRQQMELDAAQQSFSRISQLTLFDYIR